MGIEDEWTAYQLDNAVNLFGITLENALLERDRVGSGANVEYKPRYTLETLLDPAFRLPRPGTLPSGGSFGGNGIAGLLALAGQPRSGVKKWAYVGPEAGKPS